MRFVVTAALAAACLAGACSKPPRAGNSSDTGAADRSAGGAMVMQLKAKDGSAFEIHVPPPNGKARDVRGVGDLFETFVTFCLEAYPDEAAVTAKIQAGAHEALATEELADLLHGDPGQGWVVRLNHSAITLTVQPPPNRSCGVRAFFPTEPDIGLEAATYVGLWGFTRSPAETLMPGPAETRDTGGSTQSVQPYLLVGPDKRPIEKISAYISRDPNSQQAEVRLVRMGASDPR